MRLVGLLLLAAAAGFAVGRLTAPEEGGVRGRRARPPDALGPAPASVVPAASAAAPATPGVVQPTGPMELPEDQMAFIDASDEPVGAFEIDFAGFDGEPNAWVAWRTIRGDYEVLEIFPVEGETVAQFPLAPRVYDVWWRDREGRRRGARAAIEAGARTHLRAVDFATPPPVPDGFGILEVEVRATWGGGLACDVLVLRADEQDAIETNGTGHGSITLVPGRYVVELGDRESVVTVAEGQVSFLRLAHEGEGDLLLDADELPVGLGIARPGEPFENIALWTGTVDGTPRSGFVFLGAGEYDLYHVRDGLDNLGIPLGRAVVHAGRTTLFRYELPAGGLQLRVMFRVTGVSRIAVAVERVADGKATGGTMSIHEDVESDVADLAVPLGPGRYSAAVHAPGCESRYIEFDVQDRMVDQIVDMVRER